MGSRAKDGGKKRKGREEEKEEENARRRLRGVSPHRDSQPAGLPFSLPASLLSTPSSAVFLPVVALPVEVLVRVVASLGDSFTALDQRSRNDVQHALVVVHRGLGLVLSLLQALSPNASASNRQCVQCVNRQCVNLSIRLPDPICLRAKDAGNGVWRRREKRGERREKGKLEGRQSRHRVQS